MLIKTGKIVRLKNRVVGFFGGFFFLDSEFSATTHNQVLWRPLAMYLQLYHSLNSSILGKPVYERILFSLLWKNKVHF